MLRAGEGVLTGANGDAVLAVGVGEFLQRTQPLGTDESLYVDRMPRPGGRSTRSTTRWPAWRGCRGCRSSRRSRPLIAVMLGLTALGLMLFAFHALSAGVAGALLAMGLVGLDRILVYLTVGPFYNQMWGEFAMAFLLLLALRLMREPSRRTAALFALFAALGAFAYPLMLPFPIALLAVGGLVAWRRGGLAHAAAGACPRQPAARRVVLGLGGPDRWPGVLVAALGVLEKSWGAAKVIAARVGPAAWNALPIYLPFHQFFGLTDPLGLAGPRSAVGLIVVAFSACAASRARWRWPWARCWPARWRSPCTSASARTARSSTSRSWASPGRWCWRWRWSAWCASARRRRHAWCAPGAPRRSRCWR